MTALELPTREVTSQVGHTSRQYVVPSCHKCPLLHIMVLTVLFGASISAPCRVVRLLAVVYPNCYAFCVATCGGQML